MERAKAALRAIRENPEGAKEALIAAIERDRDGFLEGLGLWLAAALEGFLFDPDEL